MKYTSNIIKRFRFAENTDKQGGGTVKESRGQPTNGVL